MNGDHPARTLRWSPPAVLVGMAWLLSAGGLTWIFFAKDTPSQVFAGVTAVVLGVAALYGTVARPRLTATTEGIAVRGLTGVHNWTWPELSPRVHRSQRFGRTNAVLEIDVQQQDGTETLLVFTRLDLGADPIEVTKELQLLRAG